jgi:DNA-binding NarL/FixJ family response regulator
MPSHLQLAASHGDQDAERLRITVVVADDHAMLRPTLRRLLDVEESISVVDEASDLAAAIEHVHRARPRVLVLDLDMPSGSLFEPIRQLRTEVPWTEIVVLTTEESALVAQQVLVAGAVAVVFKDRAEAELVEAVRSAAHGEEFLSAGVATGLDVLRRTSESGLLSPREVERGDPSSDRAWAHECRGRRQASSVPPHSRDPPRPDLPQARGKDPGRARALRAGPPLDRRMTEPEMCRRQ